MINLIQKVLAQRQVDETQGIVRCGPPPEFAEECGAGQFFELVYILIDWAVYLSAMAVTAAILYGSFMYLISAGEAERINKAKGAIKAAIIGLIIVLTAWVFINTILTIFGVCSNWNVFQPGTVCGQ